MKLLALLGQKNVPKSLKASLEEGHASLQAKIARWCCIQNPYMPLVAEWRLALNERRRDKTTLATTEPTHDRMEEDDDLILDELDELVHMGDDDTIVGDLDSDGEEWLNKEEADHEDELSRAARSGVVGIGVNVEDFPLLLPSALSAEQRQKCDQSLLDREERLRTAYMESYLRDIRRLLRVRSSAYKHKKYKVRGQRASTRSIKLLSQLKAKMDSAATRFNSMLKDVQTLNPEGPHLTRYRTLKPGDLRAIQEAESDVESNDSDPEEEKKRKKKRKKKKGNAQKLGEGNRGDVSWIWTMHKLDSEEDNDDDGKY